MKITVSQDGATFYNVETGLLLFKSSLYVKDFNLQTARLARLEFIEFARKQNLDIQFEGNESII